MADRHKKSMAARKTIILVNDMSPKYRICKKTHRARADKDVLPQPAPSIDIADLFGPIAFDPAQRCGDIFDAFLVQHTTVHQTLRMGIRRINESDLWFTDLDTSKTEEIIILKAEKARGESGDWLEYDDTAGTRRFRSELRSINEWLMQADIEVDESSDVAIDPAARRLRRVFNNGSFSQGCP